MINRRFPFALFVAALLITQSFCALAASATTYDDVAAGKKDDPPKPKPTRGPRGESDDN